MIYNGIELFNTAEVRTPEDGGEGVQLFRCPKEVSDCLNPGAQNAAAYTTGSEIRFVMEEPGEVQITLRSIGKEIERAVLYFGSVQSGWSTLVHYIRNTPTTLTFQSQDLATLEAYTESAHLPFAPRVFRLLLPDEGCKLALTDVHGKARPPKAEEVPSKCLMFYGSSITHGSLACSPNGFFSARVGRAIGWDVQNQGYAGSCHMEPAMAKWLAEKGDWDAMVAELGINILGGVETEEYRRRVRNFIDTVHGAEPEKYLFLIDVFYCNDDFKGKPRVAEYRKAMAEEVAKTASPYVVYLNGLELMNGPQFLSGDHVHPNIDGVTEIATNLTARIKPYLA